MLKNISIKILEKIMYAIIETGGKQYKVSEGDTIKIEKIGNKKSVTFGDVLMVSDGEKATFGTPLV
jgi:large subunit ribosomal protein L21